MVNTDLSLEEALEIIRTETITHGNDKVRVIDVLYMLAGMKGNSGGTATTDPTTKKKIDNILKILSSNDKDLDTLQEVVDGLKNKLETSLSNISEEGKSKLKEMIGSTASGSNFTRTIN